MTWHCGPARPRAARCVALGAAPKAKKPYVVVCASLCACPRRVLTLARPSPAQDAYWSAAGEGSKSKAGKKKDDDEARRQEAAAKKAEAKRLADREEADLAAVGKKGGKTPPPKVTVAQLAAAKEAAERAAEEKAADARRAAKKEVDLRSYDALVTQRNSNRIEESVDASGVDQAIAALDAIALEAGGSADAGDKHPEKRMRAAWAAYEAAEMGALQADKPGLKRQQYRDMLWKQWQKAPQNPVNAARAATAALPPQQGADGGSDSE